MSLRHQHGALAIAICGTGIRHPFPPRLQNSQDILAWLRYILCRLKKKRLGR
jgi:hypothetical protein